jgi:hypothetical protein
MVGYESGGLTSVVDFETAETTDLAGELNQFCDRWLSRLMSQPVAEIVQCGEPNWPAASLAPRAVPQASALHSPRVRVACSVRRADYRAPIRLTMSLDGDRDRGAQHARLVTLSQQL